MDRLLSRRHDTSDLIELLRQATEKLCRARPASLDSLLFCLPIGESAWQESQPETIGARVSWAQASGSSDNIGLWAGGHEGTDYPQMRCGSYEEAYKALREQPIDLNQGTAWSQEKADEEAAAFEAWRGGEPCP